ncbi:2-oxo-4-hydroxy-4-carboxy-5-ureidoimidazoline decarboxylase [Cognatazoarcus halotolerans]|uniref:2-oxo-4-hydroxy-4-carboxy-5-ureidoimidazoline decarboxylase n=1 Tax=Cognatazoarcus halotolerans TaxID=2686016 RepID=UPI0013570DF9|nr:2-oxo-4-hydroxy-4-carboxy-5-ureidoimidazoline decarboxylase [Cognatazoarcus halotolerans]MCB1898277.1 2-oxo-4-hydroxy-4-carboxy-5-ureidoimidazoline decarboxylase [Rhodocyclaceae bacterium]
MPQTFKPPPELAATAEQTGRTMPGTGSMPTPGLVDVPLDPAGLSALPCRAFVEALAGVLEYAPQLVERAWEKRPFDDLADLYGQLMEELQFATEVEKRQLMAAHGDLGDALGVEGHLSLACLHEQRAAGLLSGPRAERERLLLLSTRYRRRFGFPCLIALQPLGRGQVIRMLARRVRNPAEIEFAENLRQLGLIVSYRIHERTARRRWQRGSGLSA